MNHEAFEKEMIDAVNRNAEEKAEQFELGVSENTPTQKRPVVNKQDARILKRGLKRTMLALWTVMQFAIAMLGFITVATAPGYLAVVLFFVSVLILVIAIVLLYAQGITYVESKGDRK